MPVCTHEFQLAGAIYWCRRSGTAGSFGMSAKRLGIGAQGLVHAALF